MKSVSQVRIEFAFFAFFEYSCLIPCRNGVRLTRTPPSLLADPLHHQSPLKTQGVLRPCKEIAFPHFVTNPHPSSRLSCSTLYSVLGEVRSLRELPVADSVRGPPHLRSQEIAPHASSRSLLFDR